MTDRTSTLENIYKAYAAGNARPFLDLLTDDADVHLAGDGALPWAKTCCGCVETEEMLGQIAERNEFKRFDATEFIQSGDRSVVLGDIKVVDRMNGNEIEVDFVHVIRWQSDRIAEFQEFFDTAKVALACDFVCTSPTS